MKCKAKAKSTGLPCQRDAVNGYEVCVVHGGKTPRGVESPHFKHGGYAQYAAPAIAGKISAFNEGDMLSLLGELSLMRGLLASFIDKYQDAVTMTESIASITLLVDNIRKLTDSVVKQRNDTALTAVEIGFIVTRLPDIVVKYVDSPDKQNAFLSELFGVVGSVGESEHAPLAITTGRG